MANKKIKQQAKASKVYLWEIALKMGIAENTLLRKLRIELSDEESSKIMHLIDVISKEKTMEG